MLHPKHHPHHLPSFRRLRLWRRKISIFHKFLHQKSLGIWAVKSHLIKKVGCHYFVNEPCWIYQLNSGLRYLSSHRSLYTPTIAPEQRVQGLQSKVVETSPLFGVERTKIGGINDWEKVFVEKGLHKPLWLVVVNQLKKCSGGRNGWKTCNFSHFFCSPSQNPKHLHTPTNANEVTAPIISARIPQTLLVPS